MNQVKDDFSMLDILEPKSSGTKDLFILDGRDSVKDLIDDWSIVTSLKEFQQKVIDSYRKEKQYIVFIWGSLDGRSVTIFLEGLSKKVNWGSQAKLDVPSDMTDDPNLFLITKTYSTSTMIIVVTADGKRKSARMKNLNVGTSYDRFNRKDRKKYLKHIREGKEIHLETFIPADLSKLVEK